ncbi:hypothetical protein F8S13_04680 [Chloroflexia bacterium SDU3-3]|nr:hypothetical protein F8S13_04680 [Chloroflexia bacterium SDU3-3]
MLGQIGSFLAALWAALGATLGLQVDQISLAVSAPWANEVGITIALLAGISMMIGQSMILFVNRLTPRRFIYSLGFFAVVFSLGQALWAATLWAVAHVVFGVQGQLVMTLRVVGVGSAPLIFGALIAIPYLGTPIEWGLKIWSMLATLIAMLNTFELNIWQALGCAIGGWLIYQLATRLFGRQLGALRDWLWRLATNTEFDTSEQELALATQRLQADLAQWARR